MVSRTGWGISMNRDGLQCLSVAGLLWYLVMWALSLLGCIVARRRYRYTSQQSSLAVSYHAPGVSILRPLKGLDTNLYENLESSFKQEYPNFEIIFSVADEDDEALTVVHALRNRYPRVKTNIIIGEEVVGVNPKVNNLMRSFRQAAHDILWVVDSGVIVDQGTLARSVAALTASSPSRSHVGVVHHVPFAIVDDTNFGSQLEAAFLNTNHARMYIAINTLGVESCVVGKSNLYRRSDIERVNGSLVPSRLQVRNRHEPAAGYGLAAFGRFLAEDNMIASAIWHELGLRHDLSCDVARNVIGDMSFVDYVWRRVRWIRVRKHMVLAATVLEPFTESVVLCAIAALSCRKLFGISMSIFTFFHFVFWLSIDLDVYSSVGGYRAGRENKFSFIFFWLAREFLAFPIFLIAVVGNEITWRGQRYKVMRDGEASLFAEHGISPTS